jgi:cobalt-precorrin 5A hydrolase / precorrin-3B C17-methyltransferase
VPEADRRVLCCSVTAAGAALAAKLPYPHVHGAVLATVAERWADVDAVIIIAATGIAVRAIAPHLASKADDPAVVCVDDAGRFAIALTGGHGGGANALARQIAALLGAQAVITTATDGAGLPGLDTLPGFTASGDIAAVTRSWLDGENLSIELDPALAAWPIPEALRSVIEPTRSTSDSPISPTPHPHGARIGITDRTEGGPGAWLRPPSLVVGVGSSSGADPSRLAALAAQALADAGLAVESVGLVATIDLKAAEPAIVELAASWGVDVRTFPASVLAQIVVPNPSDVVADAVGTPSVAEAAARLAAGPGGELVVTKMANLDATVAVARRARPEGHLAVVGLGPGRAEHRTPAAAAAVHHAEVVIGYGPYVEQAGDLLHAAQTVIRSPIGAETERCRDAVARAAAGQHVALVCSGDAGVYAMASLVFELAPDYGHPPVTVVPGVTASLAAAAVLGAPLGHDHLNLSLSDLLTPWAVIEQRLRAAAAGDFVVSLYNPRSMRRREQLPRALSILAGGRPASTPAAIVTSVGRAEEHVVRTTLGQLDPAQVGMLSLVVVGSSTTRWIGGHMVTPRGYLPGAFAPLEQPGLP